MKTSTGYSVAAFILLAIHPVARAADANSTRKVDKRGVHGSLDPTTPLNNGLGGRIHFGGPSDYVTPVPFHPHHHHPHNVQYEVPVPKTYQVPPPYQPHAYPASGPAAQGASHLAFQGHVYPYPGHGHGGLSNELENVYDIELRGAHHTHGHQFRALPPHPYDSYSPIHSNLPPDGSASSRISLLAAEFAAHPEIAIAADTAQITNEAHPGNHGFLSKKGLVAAGLAANPDIAIATDAAHDKHHAAFGWSDFAASPDVSLAAAAAAATLRNAHIAHNFAAPKPNHFVGHPHYAVAAALAAAALGKYPPHAHAAHKQQVPWVTAAVHSILKHQYPSQHFYVPPPSTAAHSKQHQHSTAHSSAQYVPYNKHPHHVPSVSVAAHRYSREHKS